MASTAQAQGHRRWIRRSSAVAVGLAVAATVGGSFFASAASAQMSKGKTPKATVQEVTRSPYGEILANAKNKTLYIQDSPGTCTTKSCLKAWPPLLLAKGQTTPTGASGLGTVTFGKRLQVTYHSMPLYSFKSDKGTSTSGENLDYFVVAQVSSSS